MVDVLVIGGGNAALCAALMAREAGASVLLLEAAPREWRGGNSMHVRNLRCMHDAPQDVLQDAYPEEEFWQDLQKVTAGRTNEQLARRVIRDSATCRDWMRQTRGALPAIPVRYACTSPGPTPSSWAGGKALVNAYYRSAEAAGCRRSAMRRRWMPDRAAGWSFRRRAGWAGSAFAARACVLAAGGFESNLSNGCGRHGGQNARRRVAGRQFFDSRHALQHRACCSSATDGRWAPTCDWATRPSPICVAIDAARRSMTAASAPGWTACRWAIVLNRDGRALLRRGRGLLAQALCHLGPPGGSAAGADGLLRSSTAKAIGRFMPPVFPMACKPRALPAAGAHKLGLPEVAQFTANGGGLSTRPAVWASLTTPGPGRLPHRGADNRPRPIGPCPWTHRPTLAMRLTARRDLHLPGPEGRCQQAAVRFGGQPSPNLFVGRRR